MRRNHHVFPLCIVPAIASLIAGCTTTNHASTGADVGVAESANQTGWAGGGGDWGGGGGQWGGGGGSWGGGGGFWGGGGGNWGGGGGQWGGGGGQWGGGGGYWGGGGGWWGGGGGNWGGGGGLWGGGFANTFPFLGWSNARHWNFRGIPKAGYTFNPSAPHTFSVAKDTTACPAGQVKFGNFSYAIDVEGWPAFAALGYSNSLCIPTPGNAGLTVNPTVGDSSLTQMGGYDLTASGTSSWDVGALKTMIGWGAGNIATQYAGALCASIGTMAAAKRSCGVGIAFTDPNRNKDDSLSQRGVTMNSAQAASFSYNTPFGRAEGHGLYGQMPGDMESYAGQVLRKHTAKSVPTTPSGIDAWNGSNSAPFSYDGADFTPQGMTSSTNATKLAADATRSLTAPLNMIPVNASGVLTTDMANSVSPTLGSLYSLSLHSLAMQQSPLYGSGGGRWFFHAPDDGTKPLLDLSSVFQGSLYVVTGQLSGTPAVASLSNAYISDVSLKYADWRTEPSTGTLYIDKAGQYPLAVASDADKEKRLDAALRFQRPLANMGSGLSAACAISSAGGALKCWGNLSDGARASGGQWTPVPTDIAGLSSGVVAIAGGHTHRCVLLSSGAVQCWGQNYSGQLGDKSTLTRNAPTQVYGLTSGMAGVSAGITHSCALTAAGGVKCWGSTISGALGDGTRTTSNTARTSPVDVSGLTSGVVSIDSGSSTTCAVLQNGSVKCWGGNVYGQLGDGTMQDRAVPVNVVGLPAAATSVEVGNGHACALLVTGSLYCWGRNSSGELGNGAQVGDKVLNLPAPVQGLGGKVVDLALGQGFTCAILQGGTVQCWGINTSGQLGNGTTINSLLPTTVALGSDTATSITAGESFACARLSSGAMKCWGDNFYGTLGDGSTVPHSSTPVNVLSTVNNANIMASQGSVLVSKFATAAGQVAGHVTPIPWSFSKKTTGTQALVATYDPLAVAAAVFIEQYDAHIAACGATISESITEADQQAGLKLWACSNANAKTQYLSGMATFLTGAKSYLFGRSDGCLKNTSVAGVACGTADKIDYANAHLPYTFVVPDYTTAAFDSGYYAQLDAALATYRNNLLGSTATRLEKTLQLAGIAKFTASNAIVTSRVARSGNYGSDCIVNDGFVSQ